MQLTPRRDGEAIILQQERRKRGLWFPNRPRHHRCLGIADAVVLGRGDEDRKSLRRETQSESGREAGAHRPASAVDDRGQRGREVERMLCSGGPGSEGSLVVRGFLWEIGRGLGRAGGVPGRDGHPPPPPRAGMMDGSRLSFSATSVPLLLVLLGTCWPSGFLCYMNFPFTLFSIFLLVFLFSSVAFELQTSPGSSSPLWTLVLVGTCQRRDS